MLRRMTIVLLMALLAACGTAAPASTPTAAPAAAAAPTAAATQPLREITVAMPYIPNVQFAQFYLADKKGYYAAEGLKIKFDYNFETDVIQRIAQGTVQFGMAGGDFDPVGARAGPAGGDGGDQQPELPDRVLQQGRRKHQNASRSEGQEA